MTEIWKSITGYDGLYSVSNLGRIISHERKSPMPRNGEGQERRRREKVLKFSIDPDGYYHCHLYKDGKRTNFAVHTLVWREFIGIKYDSGIHAIDHSDNDRKNNFASNLQLLTRGQNISKGIQWKKYLSKL